MDPVLIIGAGMAGLSAALELQRHGVPYQLLEAGSEPGGRAVSCRMSSGIVADLGAHWLHGENNPLKKLLETYGLSCVQDEVKQSLIYYHGQKRISHGSEWLEKAIDQPKAEAIKNGEHPDCPMTDVATNDEARIKLRDFAIMWNGIDPPMEPSAKEFLTDESTPGGLQLEGGMAALIDKMADAAGRKHIRLDARVATIDSDAHEVRVRMADGTRLKTSFAFITCSSGVLTSGLLKFEPHWSEGFQKHLSGMVMGKVNKIIIELEPAFLSEREIGRDISVEFLDAQPPHFCHIRSAGQPLISLFVSGAQAETIEPFTDEKAIGYAVKILTPMTELHGFESHIVGKPVVTQWARNPYIRGAYAACLPGAERSDPWFEGRLCFCGDAFSKRFPSSLAGAYLSGTMAADTLCQRYKTG